MWSGLHRGGSGTARHPGKHRGRHGFCSGRRGRLARAREPARDLESGIDTKLVEDARDVALDRSLGDEEACGHLGIRGSIGNERRHFHLPPRQARTARCGGDRRPSTPDWAARLAKSTTSIGGHRKADQVRRLESGRPQGAPGRCLGSVVIRAERLEDREPSQRTGGTQQRRGAFRDFACDRDRGENIGPCRHAVQVAEIAPERQRSTSVRLSLHLVATAQHRHGKVLEQVCPHPALAKLSAQTEGVPRHIDPFAMLAARRPGNGQQPHAASSRNAEPIVRARLSDSVAAASRSSHRRSI